jgi:Major Facilitator Superfamily
MTSRSDLSEYHSDARQIFLYFGPLTLMVYLFAPESLLDIPTAYMLKDHLAATAPQVAMFRLLTGLPLYLGFIFGLARDLWNPLGWRDRGHFMIFAPVTAAVFVWMALSRLSYPGLLVGMILATLTFRFILAAYQGLLALIGQETLMSGRLSALWSVFSYIPLVTAMLASGPISEYLGPRQTFSLAAALTLSIGVFGLWNPRAVFSLAYENVQAKGAGLIGDVRRLLRHRAIYPAILINFLWYFMPGANTPVQFYLTNHLHTSDAIYSYHYGIYLASNIPAYLLYGWLCTRVPLRKLICWGTIVGIPSMIPLAFVDSTYSALILAVPMGLMSGLGTAAYYDLTMRSCPPGLQGTLMMLVTAVWMFSLRGGDVLGSKIYASSPTHGIIYCVIAMTAVYVLILPLIWTIPKEIIATADGEPNPEAEAVVLAELGEAGAGK